MQIKINLLPPELVAKRDQRNKQKKLMAVGVGVLALFFCIYGALFLMTVSAKAEANKYIEQRQDLESKAMELKVYADQLDQVAKAEALAKVIMSNTPEWNEIIAQVGYNIPASVWLTDVSAKVEQGAEPKGEIILKGLALDHPSVSMWLEQISLIPGLYDVMCQVSSEKDFSGHPTIYFEIKANLFKAETVTAPGKAGV